MCHVKSNYSVNVWSIVDEKHDPTILRHTISCKPQWKIFRNTMMTSSNGNIFRVTWPLCREFTGHRWTPRAKASDTELWCLGFDVFFDLRLNKRLSKQWWGWWFETPSRPLWRHCSARVPSLPATRLRAGGQSKSTENKSNILCV